MDYFHLNEEKQDLLKMSNLGLAYLGDAVYEVMVRSWLCLHGKLTPGTLHRAALRYVAAPRQALMVEKILPDLTPEEERIFKRGRNTAPHSLPKAATRREYQTATGLEALFGWLYLRGETDRLNLLFEQMMDGEEG
ncbi:MAG: ribonuclease III domain-containing protein [Evtepia sp.]|uniref:Mini-ribonuclease 3 n=1 Tax=Evtepia sp. TaxID=2773933 RepID=UPI002A7514D1|nr:ribonuclease III domain-containing protein [Evtepia sp.]MDY3015022.1 ribonuclease III domain-containing protein [Evtepia sp.]